MTAPLSPIPDDAPMVSAALFFYWIMQQARSLPTPTPPSLQSRAFVQRGGAKSHGSYVKVNFPSSMYADIAGDICRWVGAQPEKALNGLSRTGPLHKGPPVRRQPDPPPRKGTRADCSPFPWTGAGAGVALRCSVPLGYESRPVRAGSAARAKRFRTRTDRLATSPCP